jgi:hypothetical protein
MLLRGHACYGSAMGHRSNLWLLVALSIGTLASGCGSGSRSTTSQPDLQTFEGTAVDNLGPDAASLMTATDLGKIGIAICRLIKIGDSPNQVVTKEKMVLETYGIQTTTAAVSAVIADAVLYVCPSEQGKFNREIRTGR